ncbi:type II secretion system protein GspG [Desulfolucanica intricata]|uniref:type II secretion system protein GspG n=1 Tax=Desulfolucanica intricata TaxID=1285191 RepID=UPI000834502B|nr:type II secretion system protein GspG [Desulfolucanica intricata]
MNVNRGSLIINLVCLVVVIGVFVQFIYPRLYSADGVEKSKIIRVQSDLLAVKKALELYNKENAEGYPPIDEVAAVFKEYGIVWSGDISGIVDPWNNAYEYATATNRECFIIISNGPDGLLGNEDDIYVTNLHAPTIGKPPITEPDNNIQWTADRSKSYVNNYMLQYIY